METRTAVESSGNGQVAELDQSALILLTDLVGAVEDDGYDLVGFSVKLGFEDCLLTVRADGHGGRFVMFVGSPTIEKAVSKAVRMLRGGNARWKQDKYA